MKFFILFLALFLSVNTVWAVDLTDSEFEKLPQEHSSSNNSNVYLREWFENIDFSGFASAAFISTGDDAKVGNEHFLAKEASLFFEAKIWEDAFFFMEWQAIRLAAEESKVAGQTAEVYIHYKNLFNNLLNVKIGRVDIPFGEEYLFQDSIDNPFVTWTVSWPYGWDEGVLLYGNVKKLGWVASVFDGSDNRTLDDHPSKSLSMKLYGDLTPWLYLSGSYMDNGKSSKSAIEFAGSHIEPVSGSSSSNVRSQFYETDAILKYENAKLWLSYGHANVFDANTVYSRSFQWYTLQPQVALDEKNSIVARYSFIGTGSDNKGYHFDGKPYADGHTALSYDAKSLGRWALAFNHQFNPRAIFKVEYGNDTYEKIPMSSRTPGSRRSFLGIETAVKF